MTEARLELLHDALAGFYRDHGRFPTEAEGLESLFSDPGSGSWRGPYLSSPGVQADALADARGGAFSYSVAPLQVDLTAPHFPELTATVTAANLLQEWIPRTQVELGVIHDAAERYRTLQGAYPASIADLVPAYLGSDYGRDPWGHDYQRDGALESFQSPGPDGTAGTADDVRAPGL